MRLMENDRIELYFRELKMAVGDNGNYNNLLTILFLREFYSPTRLDENRASDGIGFRRRYLNDEDCATMGPCRVLEMMIALAERIDIHNVGDLSLEERVKRYFWMMVENLDMMKYNDHIWSIEFETEINHRIDILLDRRYGPGGEGSLFPEQRYPINPVKKQFLDRMDPKERDIWSQYSMFDIYAWEKRKGLG